MSETFDSQAYNRDLAAHANGVDMTVDIEGDLGALNVSDELKVVLRPFLKGALDQHRTIDYLNALEQVKRMLADAKVNVEELVTSTQEEVFAALDEYRPKAPYETGPVARRI